MHLFYRLYLQKNNTINYKFIIMKKTSFIFTSIASFFLLLACTDDNQYEFLDKSLSNVSYEANSTFKVSQEEAIELLGNFMNSKNSNTTKSIQPDLKVKNIQVITGGTTLTKADGISYENLPDTIMYLVNLDNHGAALISADKRTEPIFAIFDNNNYSIEELEATENGFRDYYEAIKPYFANCIESFSTTKASSSDLAGWSLQKETSPKLNYYWHQNYPYNRLSYSGSQYYKAGCGAIALAMASAHFKVMKSLNGYTFDYSVMKSSYSVEDGKNNIAGVEQVARLVREIGVDINSKWGFDGTSAKGADIETFLKNASQIPYTTTLRKFNSDKGMENLYNCLRAKDGLILMYGSKNSDNSSAHYWLLDGIQTYENGEAGKSLDLYHCRWGQEDTSYDGYFLKGIYQFMTNFKYISGGVTSDIPSAVKYQYNLQYWAMSKKRID